MIGSVKLHYKISTKKKKKNVEQEACWELQEIISESQNRTQNKGLLEKSIEEDEVKEEHVKLAPGGRKHEALS